MMPVVLGSAAYSPGAAGSSAPVCSLTAGVVESRGAAKVKVPETKFPILMEQCGNTVSSTVPLALKQMKDDGLLAHGSRLMLLGFGVGYSWAGCIVNY